MQDNQPREFDAVLGKQVKAPTDALVLGGIESVKQRFASADIKQKIIALQDALNYDKAGLEFVIQALSYKLWRVQQAAYSLLKNRQEPFLKPILQEYAKKSNRYDCFVATARSGEISDVDELMDTLENDHNAATSTLIDYTLGLVNTNHGKERIRHYLFNGTKRQRNYAALYFKRLDAKDILDEAVRLRGSIPILQKYN
ncbi:MAG: hypothetical protein KME64_16255 [Scytonematopsis contorta HA4267-MV1]|jgi:hypothetical protein|nr:hypothetical protein [Scytonematopsis contorta HA4267-MV1]